MAATDELYAKYKDQVSFVIVYIIEPHPYGSKSPYSDSEWTSSNSIDKDGNKIKQPETYEEREVLAKLFISDDGTKVPVIIDGMDNKVWNEFGPAPNLAYLIGKDKKVIKAQTWYDAESMESAINETLNE